MPNSSGGMFVVRIEANKMASTSVDAKAESNNFVSPHSIFLVSESEGNEGGCETADRQRIFTN